MAAFCLPPAEVQKFLAALRSGVIDPFALAKLDSAGRRAAFEPIVGKDMAGEVNGLLEEAILRKDQQRAFTNWANKVMGHNPPAQRDMLTRIANLDQVLSQPQQQLFMEDLARQKLGTPVSMAEANKLATDIKALNAKKALITPATPLDAPERYAYGEALYDYKTYLGELTGKNAGFFQGIREGYSDVYKGLETTGGLTKGITATLDNSFFGRQGIKMLFNDPAGWTREFLSSWGRMAGELQGRDTMKAIYADVASRPNALNGKYKAAGIDLGLDLKGLTEEAYPFRPLEHIPIFGRLYKASESAYTGAALRLRADLADKLIRVAENGGINTLDPVAAKGIGLLANGWTGRGTLRHLGKVAPITNALFYSIRFMTSNLDFLTMNARHVLRSDMPWETKKFVLRQSATGLMKVAGGMAAILGMAKVIDPDSVDFDPRSSKFGTITIGNTQIDITGGMRSIVILAARLTPTMHDGKVGMWRETSTGKWHNALDPKYGEEDPMGLIFDFFAGKFAPIPGAIRDLAHQQDYQGRTPTVGTVASGLFVPMGIQTAWQLMNEEDKAAFVTSLIADNLGFGANAPNPMPSPSEFGPLEQDVRDLEASSFWKTIPRDQQLKTLTDLRRKLQKSQAAAAAAGQ